MAACVLPLPILLQVAEQADLETIMNLARTCKVSRALMTVSWILMAIRWRSEGRELYPRALALTPAQTIQSLIFEYEHSISRGRLLSGFILPALGPVLSSAEADRTMIEPWTFAVVRDFELRERRMSSILTTCTFLCTWTPESLRVTAVAMEKLRQGIKQALCITDLLADVAANYPRMLEGAEADGKRFRNTILAAKIRFRQVKIIRCLPTRDLAFLLALTTMAGRGYARYQGPKLETEPNGWDKVISFQEVILRHGSFGLWGLVRGPIDITKRVQDYVLSGVDDIREWECARHFIYHDEDGAYEAASLDDSDTSWMVDSLPGLHLTVMREFRARLKKKGEAFSDSNWINEVVSQSIGEAIQI